MISLSVDSQALVQGHNGCRPLCSFPGLSNALVSGAGWAGAECAAQLLPASMGWLKPARKCMRCTDQSVSQDCLRQR